MHIIHTQHSHHAIKFITCYRFGSYICHLVAVTPIINKIATNDRGNILFYSFLHTGLFWTSIKNTQPWSSYISMLFLPVVLLSLQFTDGLFVPYLYLNPTHDGSLRQLNEHSSWEWTLWTDIISANVNTGTIKIIISVRPVGRLVSSLTHSPARSLPPSLPPSLPHSLPPSLAHSQPPPPYDLKPPLADEGKESDILW